MAGPPDDTLRLLLRAREGDTAALGQLLDQQRGHLHELASRLLDNRIRQRIDASDLVQQTCLSVHKKIADFDGSNPAQFVAWLRQIHEHNIQNVVRDQLHAARRAASQDRPLANDEIIDAASETPSRRMSRQEEASRINEVLDTLPQDEREALRLRYVEGLSLDASAAALGLTRDALLWVIKRGLRRAREHLKPDHQP